MKNYNDKDFRDACSANLKMLMKNANEHIHANDEVAKQLYNFMTHHHVNENIYELFFPLEKENWPEKFQNMERHYDPHMAWPGYSSYCYIMDVIAPPLIPYILLHFGYAIMEKKLVRSAFFVVQWMVKYQEWPQGMVIDPLALINNKQPEFYIGCTVPKKDIEDWMIYRKNPLEMYVERKSKEEHEERLYNSYMESYFTQMAYEPGWFPQELINFAKKEGLIIPKQDRTDTVV